MQMSSFLIQPFLVRILCLSAFSALLWFLGGCPKRIQRDISLFCKQQTGHHCFTTGSETPSANTPAQVALPLYDTNGAPVTCWRFREKQQTVGILLTGQTHHPLTTALFHAFYFNMYAYTHQNDLLGAGYVSIVAPGGSQTSARYMEMLARWDNLFQHLRDAGWLQIRDIDAAKHKQRLNTIQQDIQQFHSSGLTRTILYYPANQQAPLLLPVYTIHREPYVVQAKFPAALFPPARVEAMGSIYYLQRYESSKHFLQALVPYYKKNLVQAEGLHALRFQCTHTWYDLFHLEHNKMKLRTLRISRTLQRIDNPNMRREEYCTPENFASFRRSEAVHARVRSYRKTLDLLNETFQDLLDAYDKGYRDIKSLRDLNTSTAIDAFLRGHILYYADPIRIDGNLQYPQTLLQQWMKESRTRIWKALHKDFQQKGHHLQEPGALGGSLQRPYTLFRVRKGGEDYLVRSYQLIGGSFAVLLDRARGVIDVITPHQSSIPSSSSLQHHVPSSTSVKAKANTTPSSVSPKTGSVGQVNTKQPSVASSQAPLLTTEAAFYEHTGNLAQAHQNTTLPWNWKFSRRQTRPHTLYELIHQPCPKNAPITPIRHHTVQELPSEIPDLPERSFRIHEGFFWMRWHCQLLTIPVRGTTQVSSIQVRAIARQTEQAILQRDAIPTRMTIRSLQPLSVQIEFSPSAR